MRLLLRIDGSFQLGDDTLLSPNLPITSMETLECANAKLCVPGREPQFVRLKVCPAHLNRSLQGPEALALPAYEYSCVLPGQAASDVSSGSELWAPDDFAAMVLDRR